MLQPDRAFVIKQKAGLVWYLKCKSKKCEATAKIVWPNDGEESRGSVVLNRPHSASSDVCPSQELLEDVEKVKTQLYVRVRSESTNPANIFTEVVQR